MRYAKIIFLVLIFVLFMVFFYQNTAELGVAHQFQFHLFGPNWTTPPMPMYALVLACFALGVILATLYFLMEKLRLSTKVRQLRNENNRLVRELEALRTLPIEQEYAPAAPVNAPVTTTSDEEIKEEGA